MNEEKITDIVHIHLKRNKTIEYDCKYHQIVCSYISLWGKCVDGECRVEFPGGPKAGFPGWIACCKLHWNMWMDIMEDDSSS